MESDLSLIKTLVTNGAFGAVTYVTSSLEKDIDKGTQYASLVNFVKVTVNNGSKKIDYNIVIKKPPISNEAKDSLNSDVAFKIEVIMYRKILPLLEAEKLNLFPKLYQGLSPANEDNNQNVLVFENLQNEGYIVTKEKIFLDYDHIELAVRKLGEFHALSYLAKQKYKDKFLALANNLIDTKFINTPDENIRWTHLSMIRGIQPLLDKNIEVDVLNKVLDKLKNFSQVAEFLIKAEEPFSVICHGDFCRNNMFFKYDQNKPIDIKFFDLQNSIYSTPAVDLAFFLYMNTTAEMRDKHWDTFLNIYWTAFSKSIPKLEFTYEEFLEHFAKKAIYGYLPTSFFIPFSIDENIDSFAEEMCTIPVEERLVKLLKLGGEEGTNLIVDIVKHLLSKCYLHKFLEL